MGKHKVKVRQERDDGDYVVVYNAKHVQLTGDKWEQKLYRWHTGYPGIATMLRISDVLNFDRRFEGGESTTYG